MCEFCDALINNKKINWLVRSDYASDNFCEYINDSNCELCQQCDRQFSITSWDYDNGKYISLDFLGKCTDKNGTDVIIHPFTESLRFNYCPICGKQISEYVKTELSYHKIEIED